MEPSTIIKIISGGQTGADRAALDFALENNFDCGGWCPKGRRAEDGKIPDHYPLNETDSIDYRIRTRKNIEDSDGTLIFYLQNFDPGTGLTLHLCRKSGKPHLIVKLSENTHPRILSEWATVNRIKILNIAGPRESSEPGIYTATLNYLYKSLQ